MAIVHMKLGKVTKRSDGRYQAGDRDLDGKRKFITCNSEGKVLERFQVLQPTKVSNVESNRNRGRPKSEAGVQPTRGIEAAEPENSMILANYMLNWLEKFKKGKIRPSSYERYQFCLQLLCRDELVQMDIRSIWLEHIQEYVNRVDEMSVSTIKKQKLLLSQVLEHAMLTEVILAARAIRALSHGASVPILAMTANAFEEDRQKCLRVGMNDHIAKPVEIDSLLANLIK